MTFLSATIDNQNNFAINSWDIDSSLKPDKVFDAQIDYCLFLSQLSCDMYS